MIVIQDIPKHKAFELMNTELLKKLAIYLNNLPVSYTDFDMKTFNTETAHVAYKLGYQCGTAACALGHLPYVEGAIKPHINEVWRTYGFRSIWGTHRPSVAYPLYNYMFDFYWSDVDNTPHGAAKRIWAVATGQLDFTNIPVASHEGVQSYQHIEVGRE